VNSEASLRPMRLEDVPVVAEIDRLSFSLPWPERSFLHEVEENDCSRCWVAEGTENDRPRVVGMLVLWLILDEAHIATLAVHPAYRRRGIGKKLLHHALYAAWREGARRAMLEVRIGNQAAQTMYRESGFIIAGIRPRYYKDTGEDAVLMTLEPLEVP